MTISYLPRMKSGVNFIIPQPKPGHLVKVRIVGPETSERIWVQVAETGSLGFLGDIANDPICHGLKRGDPIARPWDDVLDWTDAL